MNHDLRTDDFPDADGDGRRERARRTVASHATDPDDYIALLGALDLHTDGDARRTARTCARSGRRPDRATRSE
ncbi:hypothetical protein OS965_16560 [Streptomyces sp. H27-G5]|uniref:hypothetical protein n=1 Tax=Streptomyces sp. H27-G5 TaxID=2996698 RepID=UPI00226E1D6D|nr:hypothetical protein [Streptomyces sp. H27-G5]MCY0919763.1 hypothetical protein [Streptomyces sp. H27-G5]